jgi:hypothetical protein
VITEWSFPTPTGTIIPLAGLLYWIAVDNNGNQIACQDLYLASITDANNTPFPAVVGYMPWPFPGAGQPVPDSNGFPPTWPFFTTPPQPPINQLGPWPPGPGQGNNQLLPPSY